MVFTSAVFLGVFLPSLLAIYFLANEKARPYVLLVFSLLFYAWGEPTAIVVMLALMVLNYLLALGMSAAGERLIAGPIVRYATIAKDIANRKADFENIVAGFRRFTIGLAKKVLVADVMAGAVDVIFAAKKE